MRLSSTRTASPSARRINRSTAPASARASGQSQRAGSSAQVKRSMIADILARPSGLQQAIDQGKSSRIHLRVLSGNTPPLTRVASRPSWTRSPRHLAGWIHSATRTPKRARGSRSPPSTSIPLGLSVCCHLCVYSLGLPWWTFSCLWTVLGCCVLRSSPHSLFGAVLLCLPLHLIICNHNRHLISRACATSKCPKIRRCARANGPRAVPARPQAIGWARQEEGGRDEEPLADERDLDGVPEGVLRCIDTAIHIRCDETLRRTLR